MIKNISSLIVFILSFGSLTFFNNFISSSWFPLFIIDNLYAGVMDNLKEFKGEFIKADISLPFNIDGKLDVIFHQAAISDPRYVKWP